MSTENSENKTEKTETKNLKLDSVFAFKEGMSTVLDDNGDACPVTVLRFEPWVVSQVKTKEKDGYEAIQLSNGTRKSKNANAADVKRLKAAGFENGAKMSREVRQGAEATVGQQLDIGSLVKGDTVKVTSRSKGKGFAGVVKRWNNRGGPESHGSGFHRRPGSVGNRTWPGRVMPGKHFPGHLGDESTTVKSVVIDVIPSENAILLKGAVPGGRNSLVKITKV